MPLKVMTVVGTRLELIKLSRTIDELARQLNHVLVHTGQNCDYELNQLFFEELDIPRPKHFLQCATPSPVATVARVVERVEQVLAAERPDALLLLGDTNSCMAAYPAKRFKIPIFHMEAGNRCFDQRVPEEINRKIVDHISDINMPYTEHARRYLIAEGIHPETIIKTGSPMKEVLAFYMSHIMASDILDKLQIEPNEYLLVSAHREENIESEINFSQLSESLKRISDTYRKPIIVSTHPRTRKKLQAFGLETLDARVRFLKPLGFFDYIMLQKEAFCTLSDSGTLTEESSILGFPAVMLRQAHERPEGMDEGSVIMSGLKAEDVVNAIEVTNSQYSRNPREFKLVQGYDSDNVSKKVVRIIMSYTDYVNRTVWFK